jgi:hypothetical protein
MEEALYEIASMRTFASLSLLEAIPDETTILHFRHLLEREEMSPLIVGAVDSHLAREDPMVKRGTSVDATIIAAPSSKKNGGGRRDLEMHQAKKATTGTSGRTRRVMRMPISSWHTPRSRPHPMNPMWAKSTWFFMARKRRLMATRAIPDLRSTCRETRSNGRSRAKAARSSRYPATARKRVEQERMVRPKTAQRVRNTLVRAAVPPKERLTHGGCGADVLILDWHS